MRTCNIEFSPCPCKITDLNTPDISCNFVKMYGMLIIREKREKARQLLRKICPELRNKLLHHDFVARQLQIQENDFLDNVKSGEKVYCMSEISDVIFLKKKTQGKYIKCIYQTINGQIKEQWGSYFRIISKGNKYTDFKAKNQGDAKACEILAKEHGFRPEILKEGNSYFLRVYGDSQEGVDDFVFLYLRNDFLI